jgi:hypothetical protein
MVPQRRQRQRNNFCRWPTVDRPAHAVKACWQERERERESEREKRKNSMMQDTREKTSCIQHVLTKVKDLWLSHKVLDVAEYRHCKVMICNKDKLLELAEARPFSASHSWRAISEWCIILALLWSMATLLVDLTTLGLTLEGTLGF